jgi:hypothetical protein
VQNGLAPAQNVNGRFALDDAANGVEFSGGYTHQGYHHGFAVFDQNMTGVFINPPRVAPQKAIAYSSGSNLKDFYGRFVYRSNLEKDPVSRNEKQAAGMTGRAITPISHR